ncbi:MAG: hypothetical protein JWM80_4316 [Cyanobacteria bacterium RYN_339]|nr:hypothetical protein [Cyanobacteria bacterium RYN_339]
MRLPSALLLVALLAQPALAQTWRPPMVVWTTKPRQVGFYFGPYFFSAEMGLTQFLGRFGRDERTLTDSFGFKHLYFPTRGFELVATTANQILGLTFYTEEAAAPRGMHFQVAEVVTDTGLGPGNTWNDVWTVQGKPHLQKVDETGDKLYILEYHVSAKQDLDFFFRQKDSRAKIVKLGLYPRR